MRLPRDAAEARTDVRYFAAQGYDRIVVAGPRSTAAADGAAIVRVADLPAALASRYALSASALGSRAVSQAAKSACGRAREYE